MDDVSVDSREHVAAIAERTLMCRERNPLHHHSEWYRAKEATHEDAPEHLAAHPSAAAHRELFEGANVVDQNVHQPEFV